jgi:hypothetical protein
MVCCQDKEAMAELEEFKTQAELALPFSSERIKNLQTHYNLTVR